MPEQRFGGGGFVDDVLDAEGDLLPGELGELCPEKAHGDVGEAALSRICVRP